MSTINAYSEAIRVFQAGSLSEMAKNAGAKYLNQENVFLLKYLNTMVEIDYPTGEIRCDSIELTKNEVILIIQYMASACGVSPKQNWVSYIQLPGGPHHHAPFVKEAIIPLAVDFGDRIDLFKERALALGATEIKIGYFGVMIEVFPKILLAVCLWKGNDEFCANANILFDSISPLHLSTAALGVLGIEVSQRLRNVQGQKFSG